MDRELVEAARTGDGEAYADLIRVRGDRLFALAQRVLRDVDRAEDALQEALAIAWRDLPGLRDPDRFDAWLHRLVVRACIAEATRERRHISHLRVLPMDVPTLERRLLERRRSGPARAGLPSPDTGATRTARAPPFRGPRPGRDRRDPRHPGRDRRLASPPCPPRDARCIGCGRSCDRHRRTGMTRDQDIERVLERWFSEGPTQMPDRLFEYVDHIDRLPQRRRARLMTRFVAMNSTVRLAAAAVVILIVGVAGAVFLTRPASVGTEPSPDALRQRRRFRRHQPPFPRRSEATGSPRGRARLRVGQSADHRLGRS